MSHWRGNRRGCIWVFFSCFLWCQQCFKNRLLLKPV